MANERTRENPSGTSMSFGDVLRNVENLFGERANVRPTGQNRRNAPAGLAPLPTVTIGNVPSTVAQSAAQDTVKALQTGADASVSQQEFSNQQQFAKETLFGGDFGKFVGNLLETFARPEFLQPGFAGEGLAPLAKGLSAARAGIAADERAMEEAALQAAGKAKGAAGFDLQTPAIDLVQSVAGAEQAIEVINRMKTFLSKAKLGGGVAKVGPLFKDIGDFFGLSLSPTTMEQYQQAANKLKQAILASRLFGRDVTAPEYKIIDEIIASPKFLSGDEELLGKLQGLEKTFLDRKTINTRMLKEAGVPTDRLFAPNQPLATKD